MYYSLTQRLARCPTTRSSSLVTTTAGATSTIGDEKRRNPFMRFSALGDFLRGDGWRAPA